MLTKEAVAFALTLHDPRPVTLICAELGISRDTYYRYRRRFQAGGLPGLLDLSRRPARSPTATDPQVMGLILTARAELAAEGWANGARSIQARLRRAGQPTPSVSTIHRILVAHGQITAQPKKRPRSSYRRFEHPAPNACWQLDGTTTTLATGQTVVILRVIDDHSRLILATRVAATENSTDAWALMTTAMTRHGTPNILLTDNSRAFSDRRTRGGLTNFEALLRAAGITPITASPAHPQTCGKKERDWATVKTWLAARPPAATPTELQHLLDIYDLLFNDREHQGLAPGQTPTERYAATPKTQPNPTPRPGPPTIRTTKVGHHGAVHLGNGYRYPLATSWTGTTVTVVRDGLTAVIIHHNHVLARITIDPTRNYQSKQPTRRTRPRQPLLSDMS